MRPLAVNIVMDKIMRRFGDTIAALSGASRNKAHPSTPQPLDPLTPKKGFTLIELLVVIAVIATLATLTVGGVLNVLDNVRTKRIDVMCRSLEMAVVAYKAQEGYWPYWGSQFPKGGTINEHKVDGANTNLVIFTGKKNQLIFDPLTFDKNNGGKKKTYYLSSSEFLTKPIGNVKVPNKKRQTAVMSLREAIDGGATSCPLGYASPSTQRKESAPNQFYRKSEFMYFWVVFNLETDDVRVVSYQPLSADDKKKYEEHENN